MLTCTYSGRVLVRFQNLKARTVCVKDCNPAKVSVNPGANLAILQVTNSIARRISGKSLDLKVY